MSDGPRGGGERISILKQRRYSKPTASTACCTAWRRRARIDGLLQQAGVKWSVAQFLAPVAPACWCAGLLLTQMWPAPLLARCVIALLCMACRTACCAARAACACTRSSSSCRRRPISWPARMRAGHSFNNVLQMVGTELPEPLGGEFRTAHEEINYGVPMNEALTTWPRAFR